MNTEKSPFLSIIVPIYNCEKYIKQCVSSILIQSFTNYELILVDDKSTDNSLDICKNVALNDNRIKVISRETNGGACEARKTGLNEAVGEYIGFIDGDDWIEPNTFETIFKYLETKDVDVISFGYMENDDGIRYKDLVKPGPYNPQVDYHIMDGMIFDSKLRRSRFLCSVCTRVFRRKLIIDAINSITVRLKEWEDITYAYLPLINAKKIVVIDEIFYHYRQSNNSTSRHIITVDSAQNTINSILLAYKIYSDRDQLIREQIIQLITYIVFIDIIEALTIKNKKIVRDIYSTFTCNDHLSQIVRECLENYNFLYWEEKKIVKAVYNDRIGKAKAFLLLRSYNNKIRGITNRVRHRFIRIITKSENSYE